MYRHSLSPKAKQGHEHEQMASAQSLCHLFIIPYPIINHQIDFTVADQTSNLATLSSPNTQNQPTINKTSDPQTFFCRQTQSPIQQILLRWRKYPLIRLPQI